MCKQKNKRQRAEASATVGTSAYVTGKAAGKTKGVTQVKPPGNVGQTPSSVPADKVSPKIGTKVPRKKTTAQKAALTSLEIILKILNGIKIAAITVGIILGVFMILGLIYAYLAITGVIEPDPQAFFDSIKFWNH